MPEREQQQINWGRESLLAACRRHGLAEVDKKLFLCAEKETRTLGRPVVLEGEPCWRIDGSLRRVADHLGCSHEAVRGALQRLESKGLATAGRDRGGTAIVLCVARLFEDSGGVSDEPELDRPLALPPPGGASTGCQPGVNFGVNPVSTSAPEISEKGISIPSENLRSESEGREEHVPYSGSDDELTPKLTRAGGRFPWQELTDAELQTLDRGLLRRLFDAAVARGWIEHGDAEKFLAAAHHAATDPKIGVSHRGRRHENPRVRVLQWRVARRKWRGLRDESWAWARRMIARRESRGGGPQQVMAAIASQWFETHDAAEPASIKDRPETGTDRPPPAPAE